MAYYEFLFAAVVVAFSAAMDGAYGAAMVSGTVFCDQCKDGQVSLFDYPLYGIKVALACPGSDGQFKTWTEETTNWLGNFVMRFDGTPTLSGCYTQVSGNGRGGSHRCGVAAGPAKHLRLMFSMFDMEMYTVDPLVAQPAEPLAYCPRSSARRAPVRLPRPPPVRVPQPPPIRIPALPPPTRLPVLPPRPPPVPRVPFLEASACSYQTWMMPEYRCHWRVVTPDTKVAVAFGLIAARRFGTDMSLAQALGGRGEPYKTLLREGTAALLNSYNSIQFPYPPVAVVQHMNWALMGSTRRVLRAALSFMKANSGTGTNATCRLSTCN